ncbi:MAG: hypothetical protein ACXWPM_06025 [Bdellovibrionota bacterium]
MTELDYELSEADFARASRVAEIRAWRSSGPLLGVGALLVVAMIVAFFVLYSWIPSGGGFAHNPAAQESIALLAGLMLVLTGLSRSMMKLPLRRRYRGLAGAYRLVAVVEKGISLHAPWGRLELEWKAIEDVVLDEGKIYFFQGSRVAVIVAASAFSAPDRAREFTDECRGRLK